MALGCGLVVWGDFGLCDWALGGLGCITVLYICIAVLYMGGQGGFSWNERAGSLLDLNEKNGSQAFLIPRKWFILVCRPWPMPPPSIWENTSRAGLHPDRADCSSHTHKEGL